MTSCPPLDNRRATSGRAWVNQRRGPLKAFFRLQAFVILKIAISSRASYLSCLIETCFLLVDEWSVGQCGWLVM